MQSSSTVHLGYCRRILAMFIETIPTILILSIVSWMTSSSPQFRTTLSIPWREAGNRAAIGYFALSVIGTLLFVGLILFIGYMNTRGLVWLFRSRSIVIDISRRMLAEHRSSKAVCLRIAKAQNKRSGLLLHCEIDATAVRRWLPRHVVTREQWNQLQVLCE